jgi:O-acetyl-ADP-ribose deacetylase (regulator of RNase III)
MYYSSLGTTDPNPSTPPPQETPAPPPTPATPSLSTTSLEKFTFTERQGDLFADAPPTDALAHCVSQDLRMGKGIADLFKKKYGGLNKLKAQNCKVGQVAHLKCDNRYIFYLITKYSVYDKPTHEDFKKSLGELRKKCESFGVKGLSVPRIGTGLDGLSLMFVKDSLNKAFEGSNVKVTMFYL